jgi:hypothetical protein
VFTNEEKADQFNKEDAKMNKVINKNIGKLESLDL